MESLCLLTAIRQSLLPHFLARHPGHPLSAEADIATAAKRVCGAAIDAARMAREQGW